MQYRAACHDLGSPELRLPAPAWVQSQNPAQPWRVVLARMDVGTRDGNSVRGPLAARNGKVHELGRGRTAVRCLRHRGAGGDLQSFSCPVMPGSCCLRLLFCSPCLAAAAPALAPVFTAAEPGAALSGFAPFLSTPTSHSSRARLGHVASTGCKGCYRGRPWTVVVGLGECRATSGKWGAGSRSGRRPRAEQQLRQEGREEASNATRGLWSRV